MRNVHHQNNNHKRMRGRHQHHNNRKGQNPLTRSYESNGPDVKIRGTAATIAEKYIQLARDAQSSGDPVAAENYYQHAEHYFRLIAAAQEQFRQQNPGHFNAPQNSDESSDEDGDDFQTPGQNEPYAREQPQPYLPRDAQPFPPRDQQRSQPYQNNRNAQHNQSQPQSNGDAGNRDSGNRDTGNSEVGGLPSFITGGNAPGNGDSSAQPGGEGFPAHRRRRRHRGNRPDLGNAQAATPEGAEEPQPSE